MFDFYFWLYTEILGLALFLFKKQVSPLGSVSLDSDCSAQVPRGAVGWWAEFSWDSAWPCLSCTSLARPLPLGFAHRGERCRARPGIETIVGSPVFTGFQEFSLSNGHVLGFWLTFSKLSPRACGGQAGELRGTELCWAGEGGRA